ncbi:MAG: HEAT repeat domain-containing protein [Phycisphaeraceae bacterium]
MTALYHHLQAIDDPSVDLSLAAALPTAEPGALRRIVPMLLARRHPDGLLGVVLHFHRLTPALQQQVVEHVPELFRSLREAAARKAGQGPVNVIELVQRSANARLAYLVSSPFRHRGGALHEQAAGCLLHLAEQTATDPRLGMMPQLDADAAEYLSAAIDEAVQVYDRHERPTTLLAMAWLLPRPIACVPSEFSDPRSGTTQAMATMLRQAAHPAARRALLPMLAVPPLAEAAMAGLRQCGEAGTLGDALAQYHLLLLPLARKPLARLKDLEGLWPDASTHALLDPPARRGLATWIDALPAERSQKLAWLASLRGADDVNTRLAVLRRLLAMAHEANTAANPKQAEAEDELTERIISFCHDPDPALARIALRHLIAARYRHLPRLLTRLVSSPHDSVRGIASRRLAPVGFARLWTLWSKLQPARRQAAAQALIKIDPQFHQHLGDRLRATDRKVRLQALAMIDELNQAPFFETMLQRLAHDKDEVVASAAVKALGAIENKAAQQSVVAALDHEDSRVRANAVEAIEQLGLAHEEQHLQRLMLMAEQEDNRPRANAIHALLPTRTGEALHALTRMLADGRSEHRASALWLVEHMGLLALARQVAEMSLRDPNEQIRGRADTVIHKLIDRLTTTPPADRKQDSETRERKASAG